MSQSNTPVKITLEADGAAQELSRLTQRVDTLRDALTQAQKANDGAGAKRAEKAYQTARGELRQYQRGIDDTRRAATRLSRLSFGDLKKEHTRLNRAIKEMNRNSREYKQTAQRLKDVNQQLAKSRREMGLLSKAGRKSKGVFQRFGSSLAGGLKSLFHPVTAILGSLTGLLALGKKAVDAYSQFEAKVANLSALTGLQGQSLQWLEDQAKAMSKRMAASADEVIDAFTRMGSAKPELLKDKEALVGVTNAALTLADAAKMEVGQAVDALAATMNQFGASAQEADRYINVLAAGSKEGAAGVEQVSKSIVKFGATAASANIPVEESVALIETLAEKGLKGEVAGTQLNGVLLKLQKGADEFNPQVVGLSQALDNLAAANLSATEKIKLFGEGNYVAGQILMENRARVADYAKALTGTSTAFEQALTNTSTLQEQFAQMKNRGHVAMIDLGKALAPVVNDSLQYLRKLFREGKRVWLGVKDYVMPVVNALSATLGALFKGFGNGLQALGAMTECNTALRESQDELNETLANARVELGTLVATVESSNEGSAARREAIARINQAYGQYLPQLLTEKSSLEEVRKAQQLATEALEYNMTVKARQSALEGNARDATEREIELWGDINDKLKEAARQSKNFDLGNALAAVREYSKAGEKSQAVIDRFNAAMAQYDEVMGYTVASRLQGWKTERELLEGMVKGIQTVRQEAKASAQEINTLYDAALAGKEKPKTYEHGETPTPQKTGGKAPAETPNTGATRGNAGGRHAAVLAEEKAFFAKESQLIDAQLKKRLISEQTAARKRDELQATMLLNRMARLRAAGRSTAKEQRRLEAILTRQKLRAQQERDRQLQRLTQKGDRKAVRALKRKNQRIAKTLRALAKTEVQIGLQKAQALRDIEAQREAEETARAEARQARNQLMGEQLMATSATLSQGVADMILGVEGAEKNFAKSMVMLGLDTLHKIVQLSIASIIAQATAGPDSILTFGVAGAAKAAALTAVVEGAFQVAKGFVAKQFYTGRVDPHEGTFLVEGERDGQPYAVPHAGSIEEVAYIPNPTLISERGGEIIIDHARSQNILLHYPELLRQIQAVPQHAEGRIPPPAPGAGAPPMGAGEAASPIPDLRPSLSALHRALMQLNGQLRHPLTATISYREVESKVNAAQRSRHRAER